MVSGAGCNAHLVTWTGKHPGPNRYLPLSTLGTGIFSNATGILCCHARVQQLHGATYPTLSGPQCLPANGGSKVWLMGLLPEATAKDLGICQALQLWANLARPSPLGKSCQLAECVKELREWREPVTTFADDHVFELMKAFNWVWVTPSKSMETLKPSPPWEHSSGRNCGTRMRGMGPTIGMGHLKLTVPSTANTPAGSSQKTGAPNISTQWVKTLPGSPGTQRQKSPHEFAGIAMLSPKVEAPLESTRAPWWMPPPGFAEIASTLRRSQTSQPLAAEEQALPWLVGSTVVVSRMVQDVWGMMTINMMTCQLHLMGLGSPQSSSTITIREIPAVVPTPEDTLESGDWRQMQPLPSDFISANATFLHLWWLTTLILCRTVSWGVLTKLQLLICYSCRLFC